MQAKVEILQLQRKTKVKTQNTFLDLKSVKNVYQTLVFILYEI